MPESLASSGVVTLYPPERQRAITDFLVATGGRLGVAEIAVRLKVTTETVRRDLDVLERRGLVRRVRGAAQLVPAAPFERALAARHAEQRAEKERIAAAVVAGLGDDGVIVLDSGSLTYVIARHLPADRPFTVVTNNLPAARLLAGRGRLTVLTLPGTIRGLTQASVDGWTTRRLESVTADVAIVGVNGLTVEHGMTTTNPEEAAVKRAMLLCARRRIAPVISSRVGRNSFCAFGATAELDAIYTDQGADPDLVKRLGATGPEVTVA